MGTAAGLFGRRLCRGQGAVFAAMLLVPVLLGEAHAAAASTPWWATGPEALAFDPFSLSTDPGLLAFYQSLFGPAATARSLGLLPKSAGASASPSAGSTSTSTRPAGMTEPAPTASPTRDGSESLSVVRHAFQIAPRPAKRTPILPPWP
ncbi:MAG: hypothetical protein FJ290_16780 [Planctomycetes bacterium]|nr:hypothetical protein [Planctomycetota bacterium]